jgi:Ricin-type beta-trefoil lectin domain/Subtilase family
MGWPLRPMLLRWPLRDVRGRDQRGPGAAPPGAPARTGGIMRVAGLMRRCGLAAALGGLGLLGLAVTPGIIPAASAASRQATPTPPSPTQASPFRPVCPVPTQPSQMTCMALLPASNRMAPSTASPAVSAYGPAILQEAYHLGKQAMTAPTGGTDTVAVVDAYSDPRAAADLAVYRARYRLPSCADGRCLTIVDQTGGSRLPATDPTGAWELEESLDLDMISAICPYCRILLVEANSDSISNLATAERYATGHASAVSNSWGSGTEFVGESAYDADFYKPGVAITAAAGDEGYGTQYPAASPDVTAVGGTSLTGATATSPGHQSAWDETGAGCSALQPRPSWQAQGPDFPAGCQNRTQNDLSAVASPDPGVAAYDSVPYSQGSGSSAPDWTAVGGTSVAAPIIAAAYALADISTGKPGTGLVPGTLPAAYPYSHRSDFTDLTRGSDGSCPTASAYLCHAQRGYDGPTGLGTLDGTAGLLGPAGTSVTVIDPGPQVFPAGGPVRLAIRALATGGAAVSYSAAGLPSGLRLSGDVISGTLPARPGVYPLTVTAADGHATGSAAFSIVAVAPMTDRHPGSGPVRSGLGNECLTGTSTVQVGTCATSTAQNWQYLPDGSPGGPGRLERHGQCLTASAPAGSAAGATLASCTGAVDQRWQAAAAGQLRNPRSGPCLTAPGGTAVGLRPCDGQAGQTWTLPSGPVLAGISGECLADPGDSDRTGTPVVIAACAAGAAQRWTAARDATIKIAGRCLSIAGDSLQDGAAAELAPCGDSLAQRWQPGPDGQLVNENSGLCLSDPQDATADATSLLQSDCYAEPGQIWAVS